MVEFVPRAAPRSTLNQIGLSLPPAKAELEQRRRQYHQEQAEAQAAAQARQREAEEHARQEVEAQRQQQIQQTRLEHRRREEQEQRRLIQTNFQGCRTILVANSSRTTLGRASTVHDQLQPGLLQTGPSAAAPRTQPRSYTRAIGPACP